jgi:hypothetical protein
MLSLHDIIPFLLNFMIWYVDYVHIELTRRIYIYIYIYIYIKLPSNKEDMLGSFNIEQVVQSDYYSSPISLYINSIYTHEWFLIINLYTWKDNLITNINKVLNFIYGNNFIQIYERHMPSHQINVCSAQERLNYLMSIGLKTHSQIFGWGGWN